MFTGLIEGIGTALRIDRRGDDARMVIRAEYAFENAVVGESIAVDGACLTVVEFHGSTFVVDVSAETLQRTTLGRKSPGDRLNLERALRLGDRLGGHLVTGHVDGLGTLVERFKDGHSWRLVFQVPANLSQYIIEKGSIAVNGVSLTVNGCSDDHFHVNIIPHTATVTTIDELAVGDLVNIETDMIGKYVEKILQGWKLQSSAGKQREKPVINEAFLEKYGFR